MSNNNVNFLIEKANKFLNTAEQSLNHSDYDSSVSRTYYAMVYVVKALLSTKNVKTKSHKGLISAFGENFVKTNLFPKEFGKNLKRAFDLRLTGDYEFTDSIDKKDAEELLIIGKVFVEKIKQYLKEKTL